MRETDETEPNNTPLPSTTTTTVVKRRRRKAKVVDGTAKPRKVKQRYGWFFQIGHVNDAVAAVDPDDPNLVWQDPVALISNALKGAKAEAKGLIAAALVGSDPKEVTWTVRLFEIKHFSPNVSLVQAKPKVVMS